MGCKGSKVRILPSRPNKTKRVSDLRALALFSFMGLLQNSARDIAQIQAGNGLGPHRPIVMCLVVLCHLPRALSGQLPAVLCRPFRTGAGSGRASHGTHSAALVCGFAPPG